MEKGKLSAQIRGIGDEISDTHPGNASHSAVRSVQFRRFLESKGLEWLFLFWLDCEFYNKTIRKTKVKQENAKRIYAKWVVPYRNALPKDVVSDIELKVKAAVIDDQIFVSAMPMFDKALSAEWRRFVKTIVRRNRSGSRLEPMRSKSAENVLSYDPPTSTENSDAFDYIARKMFNAQTGVRLQSRKVMLRTVNFTFTGSEGVDWIVRNLYVASDRTKATELGNFIMQHAGGTFEQIGSTAKRIGIMKDDNTLYKPLKIYQDQVVEVSQDEFAKQLQLSSDDEEASANGGPDVAGSESQVKRTNSGGELWISASTATPLEGSIQSPDHSNSTTPRSGPNSRPSSRTASSRSLPRNSIHSGYVSQGESGVVTVEINIDDAEKGAKRRRAASVANIIRPISVGTGDGDKRKPYEYMENLILDPDMTLLMVIADIGLPKRDVEHFARAVVYIHCQSGTDMLPVLNLLLADEMLLFRSNNFNTYALSAFAKQVGQSWLRSIFQPVLESLSTHDEIQFDEDGYIMQSSERPFCALLEEVMDRICSSVSDCPPQLRLICKNILELLPAKNKPEMFFHISSFLFLRVICPALLVPDEYGLLSSPLNHHRQRILVQLSKTIQSYCGQKAERPKKQPPKRVRRNDATTDTDGESDNPEEEEVIAEEPASELPLLQGMAAANKAALSAFVQRLTAIGHLRKVKPFKLEHPSKEVHQRALQAIHSLLADRAQEILNRIQSKYPEMLSDISYMIEQLGTEAVPELKRAASAVTTKSRSKSSLNSNVLRL